MAKSDKCSLPDPPASIEVQTSDEALTTVELAVYQKWELAMRSFASKYSFFFPSKEPMRLFRVDRQGLQKLINLTNIEDDYERKMFVQTLKERDLLQIARAGIDVGFKLALQTVRREMRQRLLTSALVVDISDLYRDFGFVFENKKERESWKLLDHAVMHVICFLPNNLPDFSDVTFRSCKLQAMDGTSCVVPIPLHPEYQSTVLHPLFEIVSTKEIEQIPVPVPNSYSISIVSSLIEGNTDDVLTHISNDLLRDVLELVDFLDLRFLHNILWSQIAIRCLRLKLLEVENFMKPFWRFQGILANCPSGVAEHLQAFVYSIQFMLEFYDKKLANKA